MTERSRKDEARDEVLGERLRSALQELAPRGEPDFEALYAAAAAPGIGAGKVRQVPRSRPFLLLLPAAAALALALGLGGAPQAGPAPDPFREELARLVGENVGPAQDLALSGEADSLAVELGAFVADLWSRPGESSD